LAGVGYAFVFGAFGGVFLSFIYFETEAPLG